jgi:hypothetical protein
MTVTEVGTAENCECAGISRVKYFRSWEPVLILRGAQPAGAFLPSDDALVPSDLARRLAPEH